MDTFRTCQEINDLLLSNRESEARDALIQMLDYHEREGLSYDPLVNHLIRATGLYPYLEAETASWEDRFIFEAFKVDVGSEEPATLHREQSVLLKRLLGGENLAISAPTSFGKSFIIDAFISLQEPRNVVIIVPTLALTDETRRRVHKKFSPKYKIITTAGVDLGDRNIFVFPQERASGYVEKLGTIDLLVIDEFYKASATFDKERSPALLRAILKLSKKAKQRYFLAPNITALNSSVFTKGMQFERLDFNTVFLEKFDLYKSIRGDSVRKSEALAKILLVEKGKSLIYAGTYSNIDKVANLILDQIPAQDGGRLADFSRWLGVNYDPNWQLTGLIKRGAGIHNGQLHRSLSQIQVRLFEEDEGLTNLISTSSIIEGVNTSAENVIIWSNRKGRPRLDDFTYRNIIGRGGRMFRHFIGKIYILEDPPESEDTELSLAMPDELLGGLDEQEFEHELSLDQIAKIIEFKNDMRALIGVDAFRRIEGMELFQSSDCLHIYRIARDIVEDPQRWAGLSVLNSRNPIYWENALYRVIALQPGGWDASHRKVVAFIKILADNWALSIPRLLKRLDQFDIDIDLFFKLERHVSYKLAALLNDLMVLHREILGDDAVDISPFIARVSHAFLPPLVYQLEEYGLPRMIAKKLHDANLVDFTSEDVSLHEMINRLNGIGVDRVIKSVRTLDSFDIYILEYFFEGIFPSRK